MLQVTAVREGTLGTNLSPASTVGSTAAGKVGLDSIGRSSPARANGAASAATVGEAVQAGAATVTTTVTTKIEPPVRPQVWLDLPTAVAKDMTVLRPSSMTGLSSRVFCLD